MTHAIPSQVACANRIANHTSPTSSQKCSHVNSRRRLGTNFPLSSRGSSLRGTFTGSSTLPLYFGNHVLDFIVSSLQTSHITFRSEERRVGKECRSRWS